MRDRREVEYVEITFDRVEVCTKKAAKLIMEDDEGNEQDFWLAYSLIEDGDRTVRHHKSLQDRGQRAPVTVSIADWLAAKLELV